MVRLQPSFFKSNQHKSILVTFTLLLCLARNSATATRATVTFSNELPTHTIALYWEGNEEVERLYQGDLPPRGGQLQINSFTGHRFSYDDKNGMRHTVVVPERDASQPVEEEFQVFVVLTGFQTDIRVMCTTTTNGGQEEEESLDLVVKPQWSPRGASRFLELVRRGYYDGVALTRVVPHFLTQFGISPDLALRREFESESILDDVPHQPRLSFQPGMISYAGSGPHSRTTEIFVVMPDTSPEQLRHFGTNPWETPFAMVDSNVKNSPVARWYSRYGDMPPWGEGPDPQKIYPENGYDYLKQHFSKLDYLGNCVIVDEELHRKEEERRAGDDVEQEEEL